MPKKKKPYDEQNKDIINKVLTKSYWSLKNKCNQLIPE